MAALAGNDYYLTIDAIDVSAYVVSCSIRPSANVNDTTHGYGTDWQGKSAGIKKATLNATLVYDVTAIATYVDHVAPGQTVAVVFGLEGNTAGKPKHDQSFVLADNGDWAVNVDKSMTVISITGESTGAPTTDMFAGGTF